jgi:hypothetical protein
MTNKKEKRNRKQEDPYVQRTQLQTSIEAANGRIEAMFSQKGKVIRVKSWEKFRQLLIELKPSNIIYNLEKGVPAGSLKGLRLIITLGEAQYVFIDTAVGDSLRKTGIPLHKDGLGNQYITEEDLVRFIKQETGREDILFLSYWTI